MRISNINSDGFRFSPSDRDISGGNQTKFNLEDIPPPTNDAWRDLEFEQEGDILIIKVTGGENIPLADDKRASTQSELYYLLDRINAPLHIRFETSNLTYLTNKAWLMLSEATKKMKEKDGLFEVIIPQDKHDLLSSEEQTTWLLNSLNIIVKQTE